jgi:hypothetical protein
MRRATHQLVLQFTESAFPTIDDLVEYEEALIDTLGDNHDVDGHDIGSGDVNFFILTNDPDSVMVAILGATSRTLVSRPGLQAAARLVDGEVYQRLWPVDAHTYFRIS